MMGTARRMAGRLIFGRCHLFCAARSRRRTPPFANSNMELICATAARMSKRVRCCVGFW